MVWPVTYKRKNTRTKKKGPGRPRLFGSQLSTIKTFADLKRGWQNLTLIKSTDIRTRLNRMVQPSRKGFSEYRKTLDAGSKEWRTMWKAMMYVEWRARIHKEKRWDKVLKAYKESGVIFSKKGMDIDHKEFNVVGTRARTIYEGLLDLDKNWARYQTGTMELVELVGHEYPETYDSPPIGMSGTEGFVIKHPKAGKGVSGKKKQGIIVGTETFNHRELKRLIEWIRRLYIVAISLSQLPQSFDKELTIAEEAQLVKDFINNTSQADWELIKDKHIDVINGKAQMEVAVVTKQFNRGIKGKIEQKIGGALDKLLKTQKEDYIKQLKGVDWTGLTGSKGVRNAITEQIGDIVTGRRPKKHKSATSGVGTTKARGKIGKEYSKPKKTDWKPLGAPIKTRRSKRGDPNSLVKLEALIQKRLPAEVRRNMGRPALINRTGRFSNSVELGKLRETPAGISGTYTYRKSPYETFENIGSRTWPAGYNPKPLIAKSIRKLAVQYTNKKFTQLRRT